MTPELKISVLQFRTTVDTTNMSHYIQELQFYHKEHCIDLQSLITNSTFRK
jgi:hypothetical protein